MSGCAGGGRNQRWGQRKLLEGGPHVTCLCLSVAPIAGLSQAIQSQKPEWREGQGMRQKGTPSPSPWLYSLVLRGHARAEGAGEAVSCGAGLPPRARWKWDLLPPALSVHPWAKWHKVRLPCISPLIKADGQPEVWSHIPAKYLKEEWLALGELSLQSQQAPGFQSMWTQKTKSVINSTVFLEPLMY